MCGIIGILGREPAALRLLDGLRRLKYRGYDSAGIATLEKGILARCRAEGKLAALERRLEVQALYGSCGIGHTRWATHGKPVERNAHPHSTPRVAAVQNGIIESFRELRAELGRDSTVFESDTDTETAVALIDRGLRKRADPVVAVSMVLAKLKGTFALAIIFYGRKDLMIAARRGSPLAPGYGDGKKAVMARSGHRVAEPLSWRGIPRVVTNPAKNATSLTQHIVQISGSAVVMAYEVFSLFAENAQLSACFW